MTAPGSELAAATATATDEATCRRCGASCHVAVPAGPIGAVVVPGLHCQFLAADGDRFTCTVYADRYARAPWCHSAAEAQPQGYLATDCPYGPNADGKLVLPEDQFVTQWPAILRNLRAWGVPVYVHQQALLQQVEKRTRRKWTLQPWPGDPERLRLAPVGFAQPYLMGTR